MKLYNPKDISSYIKGHKVVSLFWCFIVVLVVLSIGRMINQFDFNRSEVVGRVVLPPGLTAFEDTRVTISCNGVESDIPVEETVLIPKGESSASFKLMIPNEPQNYYYRYTILSKGGEGTNDARLISNSTQYSNLSVGGLSISNHVYVKEGYAAMSGMTADFDKKRIFDKKDLNQVTLTLIQEPGIQAKTEEILNRILNKGMTDYEKEKAIYQYVIGSVPLTSAAVRDYQRNAIQEFDNPLAVALFEQKTVWLGQPFLMKWLLHSAGLASELVEVRLLSYNFTYVYNLVSINGDKYYVDPVSASSKIHDKNLEAGELVFENQAAADRYFSSKYFNFTDYFIRNQDVKVVAESGLPSATPHGGDSELIKNYLKENNLGADKVVQLDCELILPDGIKAPEYGVWVGVTVTSGQETPTLTDDFAFEELLIIPSGKKKFTFKLDVVNTGQKMVVSAIEKRSNIHGSAILNLSESDAELKASIKLKP